MGSENAGFVLALATEVSELRAQLAEAQELLIETAVDAGELHARIGQLQAALDEIRSERDAWMIEAQKHRAGRAIT